MVDVTIYIEGVQSQDKRVLTTHNENVFRENFRKLFFQKLPRSEFHLTIQSFGSVTKTRKKLEHIEKQEINGVILIDLDAPKEKRDERLERYKPSDTMRIFFMIQEMEAWIISQVDKIEQFGKNEGLIRKRSGEDIAGNPLIKNKHPENIEKPSEKLNTILSQYFDAIKVRRGKKPKTIGKRYLKAKDGPKLIGLLDLQTLMECFDEAKRLVEYIKR